MLSQRIIVKQHLYLCVIMPFLYPISGEYISICIWCWKNTQIYIHKKYLNMRPLGQIVNQEISVQFTSLIKMVDEISLLIFLYFYLLFQPFYASFKIAVYDVHRGVFSWYAFNDTLVTNICSNSCIGASLYTPSVTTKLSSLTYDGSIRY